METILKNVEKEKDQLKKEHEEIKHNNHTIIIDHHPISFEKKNYSFFDCKPPSHPNRYPFYRPTCISNDLEIQKEETKRLFRECPYLKGNLATIYQYTDGYSIPFKESFKVFEEFVYCQIPFGFMRFGDGEQLLMDGVTLGSQMQSYLRDKWTWKGGIGKLSKDIKKSLSVFLEISFMDFLVQMDFLILFMLLYHQQIQKLKLNLFYIQHFSISNYYYFVNFMNDILEHKLPQSVILVINHSSKIHHDQFLKFAHEIVYIIDDGPQQYEDHRELLLSQMKSLAKSHAN